MPETTRMDLDVDRVRGSFLGLAIGDALGAPLEGLSAPQIRAHYRTVVDYVDGTRAWRRKPFRWRLPGLYTDDTQQALALADVLLETGHVAAPRLAELYLALLNPKGSYAGAHRGIGRSFRLVLAELQRGVCPSRTGQVSAGIGAAMRIAPVALYFARADSDTLFDAVMASSLMTHRDVRSLAGALAVAYGVRRLLRGEPRNASFPLRLAGEVHAAEARIAADYADIVVELDAHRHSVSTAIAAVERLIDAPPERAWVELVDEANRHGSDPVCKRPTMGFPPACIPSCLYVLLTASSFEEALIEIINQGGDADSAGAILGALAGASHGLRSIPTAWLAGLKNRDGIDLRARALARHSTEGLTIPDFLETERRLSDEEAAHREGLMLTQRPSGGGDMGARGRLF